jgi:hypothetical protein
VVSVRKLATKRYVTASKTGRKGKIFFIVLEIPVSGDAITMRPGSRAVSRIVGKSARG